MLGGQTTLILQVLWHHTLPVAKHLVIALPVMVLLCKYQGYNNQREVSLLYQ